MKQVAWVGPIGYRSVVKLLHREEVPGSNPRTSKTFIQPSNLINQQYRDTWHEMIGPRVQIYSLPMTRVHTVFVQNRPTSSRHVTPLPSQQKVRPSTWPYGLYGQVQSAPNFDHFDSVIKSRYLLHTDSIRENKYTAGIRKTRRTQWHWFRLNPSTLKIEQILIP
jgi:hypothetical protein